jgi:Ca-activated chloride channel family protein
MQLLWRAAVGRRPADFGESLDHSTKPVHVGLAALICWASTAAPIAVVPRQSPQGTPQFGTSVQVVEVYASVTDRDGEPVRGLPKHAFSLREDGRLQEISTFIEGEFPLSIAIAVDRSLSMAGDPLLRARRAARTLLDQLRPDDQAMIIAVSSTVDTVAPLATRRDAAIEALTRLDPWSTTALHDAMVAAIDEIESGHGRRALVLLSDGTDRYSHSTAADVLERVRRSEVLVYPVALGKTRPPLFAEAAALSGGRSFYARDARTLDAAMGNIARDLRHQYLLGYSPAKPLSEDPGHWRSIQVHVAGTGVTVRARDGYYVD